MIYLAVMVGNFVKQVEGMLSLNYRTSIAHHD